MEIKYKIKKLDFVENATSYSSFDFFYKKEADSEWVVVKEGAVVDVFGNVEGDIEVSSLEENTLYEFKAVNTVSGDELVDRFVTSTDMQVGESPLYLKKLYKGQHFTWYINGLPERSEPSKPAGFYYKATDKFAEYFGGFGPLESPNGKLWGFKANTALLEDHIVSKCFQCSGDKYLGLNWSHENPEAQIYAHNLVASQNGTLCVNFYIDANHDNVAVVYIQGKVDVTKFFKVGYENGIISLSDDVNSYAFAATFEEEKWYSLRLSFGTDVKAYVYDKGELVDSLTADVDLSFITSTSYDGVFFGLPVEKDALVKAEGLNINRIYFTESLNDAIYTANTNGDAGAVTQAQKDEVENLRRLFKFYEYEQVLVYKNATSDNPSDTVFFPKTAIKIGDKDVTDFRGATDRSPITVDINYDLNVLGNGNAVDLVSEYIFKLKAYLYQYVDSSEQAGETEVSGVMQVGAGNNLQLVIPNDYAFGFRLDAFLELVNGTAKNGLDFQLNTVHIDGGQINLSTLFTVAGVAQISDNVDGELLALSTINGYHIQVPVLSTGNITLNEFKTHPKWSGYLRGDGINMVVDPTIPSGKYVVTIKSEIAEELGALPIEVVEAEDDVDKVGFEIDLENAEDFNAELAKVAQHFDTNHTQWGGENGGCSGELIYVNNNDRCITMEQHGDKYPQDGAVKGVQKGPKDSSFKGYGTTSYHYGTNDPLVGQVKTKRTGSILLSKKYFPYGEFTIGMRVPKDLIGVSPALWFFHYIELYPSDPRWDYWTKEHDPKATEYSGGDPYLVVNNEIDMELPSQLAMGVFATWNELQNAYFDPLALDDKFHTAVENDNDPNNVGTFKLIDIANPNLRASWERVSVEIQEREEPTMDICKFNNWQGERSGGNGWAYDQESYAYEQYHAKLTQLAQNYADGEFHKWGIAWYPDRTELKIDGVTVATNKAFVPFNIMKYTAGGWFPSYKSAKIEEFYTDHGVNMYESGIGSWAGRNAAWDVEHIDFNYFKFEPFDIAESDSKLEYHAESYPEAGVRELHIPEYAIVENNPITPETNAVLNVYGKTTWSLDQKLAIQDFLSGFNAATWKSKVKRLVLPILAPETTIHDNVSGVWFYDLVSGTILNTIFGPSYASESNGFYPLRIVDNGLKNPDWQNNSGWADYLGISFDVDDVVALDNIHLGAYYYKPEDESSTFVMGALQEYTVAIAGGRTRFGHTSTGDSIWTDADVNKEDVRGFRLISYDAPNITGVGCGDAILHGNLTDNGGMTTTPKYDSYLISRFSSPPTKTTLSLLTIGDALTLEETQEYTVLVDDLMSALWTV
ncbi:hypothetical protein [Wenyingzhuangia sp. IMCC45574]